MALRVLIVDDHRLFRAGLRALLTDRGIDVVGEAADGDEALLRVRELNPELVLLDLEMPRRNGLEATRLIKAERPDLPVVILTASEEADHLFEAVKAGAQGYLLKSLAPDDVVTLVQAAARGEAAITPQLAARLLAEFARLGAAGGAPAPAASASSAAAAASTPAASAPSPAPPTTPPAAPPAAGAPAGTRQVDLNAGHATAPAERAAPSAGAPDGLLEPLTAREREVLELLVAGATNKEIASRLYLSENTVKYHLKNILGKLQLHNRAQVVAYALRHRLAAPPEPTGGG